MQQEGLQFRLGVTEHAFAAVTDADGVAEVAAMPLGAGEFRLARDASDGPRCIPLPPQRHALPEVDLADAAPLALRVRDAEGRGARCRGVAMPAVEGEMLLQPFGCEPRLQTDVEGRAALRLLPGRWWIFVHDGDAFAHQLVEVARDGAEVALALRQFASWTLQVAGRDGLPAAGARFDGYGQVWIDGAAIPEDLLARQFLSVIDSRIAGLARADAQGRLVVRFAPPEVMTTLGRVRWGGQESAEMHLRPGAPRHVVVR
jgi:hypothetical protein